MDQIVLPVLDQTIVLLIEQSFNQDGIVPSIDALAERLDLHPEEVSERFAQERDSLFWQVMERKYLAKYYPPPEASPLAGLSADQLLVLDTLLDPHDKSSMMQKLRRCGKTSAWLQAQLKDPIFAKEIDQRSKSSFRNQAYRVREAIANAAAGGDAKMATLYMELIGEYQRSSNLSVSGSVSIESNRVVALLVEVIQRHVEPEKFAAIASDFEAVLNGKPLPVAAIPSLPVGSFTPPAETFVKKDIRQELIELVDSEVPEARKLLFEGFDGDDS